MKHLVPVIDIRPLIDNTANKNQVAEQIKIACCDTGFFYISNHGVSLNLQQKLYDLSKKFFALPEKSKMEIAMTKGGKAWRGYFPVGQELTSGKPDLKEGVYFGEELDQDHPLVKQGLPLHGANLFLEELPEFKKTVLEYMAVVTDIGHVLMKGISLSLGLGEDYFLQHFTKDPLILFRIFNYPYQKPVAAGWDSNEENIWGVGEHTDYGVLTILLQDDCGGLEVKSKRGWIEAPPIPNTFVCNIGDMLEKMTRGLYKSTPHRVRNASGKDRLSFPLFFDPNFSSSVEPLPISGMVDQVADDSSERWDQRSVHFFQGTYGDYLLGKIGKVFPGLGSAVGVIGKRSLK